MSDPDCTSRILAFALHCGLPETGPDRVAERRGWIDASGHPTSEGLDLLRALDEQRETRSVFVRVL